MENNQKPILTPENREADIQAGMAKGLTREEAEDLVNAAEWCTKHQGEIKMMYLAYLLEGNPPAPFMLFAFQVWEEIGRENYKAEKEAEGK